MISQVAHVKRALRQIQCAVSSMVQTIDPHLLTGMGSGVIWLREKDSNLRLPGYEPGSLPTDVSRDNLFIQDLLVPELRQHHR